MDIHSMDSDDRDAESMKWTTSLGAVEDSDELSLMDPLYDLTSARMKKLFSSFNPQGSSVPLLVRLLVISLFLLACIVISLCYSI